MSDFPARAAPRGRLQPSLAGFTLTELLVAVTILVILTLVLCSMADQAARFWTLGQSQTQYRQRARAALSYIGQDLKQAVLAANNPQSTTSLELVINPALGTSPPFNCPDALFWQAPVATDSSAGDLAEVGYYVSWTDTQANLYRFLVNPSDANGNYLIYNQPASWISQTVLQKVNPSVFLNNVLGLWIAAFQANGTAYAGGASYDEGDSRTAQRLPAYVQISLVFLTSASAARVTAANAATIQGLYASGSGSADTAVRAQTFINDLPASIRPGASVATLQVSLDNYK